MGAIDPQSVTRLWDQQSAALVLYARQWCDAPEDVVQEAFLLLVRQVVAPENVVGWIYRVVRNRAINAARSSRRKSRREAAVAPRGEPWFEANPGDRLDAQAATDALRGLPMDEREVIVGRLWGGLALEEIARLTGSSTSTVHRLYQRGLNALRERLGVACPTKKTRMKT